MSLPDNFDYSKGIIDKLDDKMKQLVHNYDNVKCFHANQSLSGDTRSVLN